MTATQPNQQMKKRLLQLREELENITATGEESAAVVELDQSKVGRLSRMGAMQAQAMAKASVSRRKTLLKQISAALQRIDDGEYGTCQSCDEPINPKRLNADPTALYCVTCAARLEEEE